MCVTILHNLFISLSFTIVLPIYWDNQKFPSGMKALGDYIHSLGLKYVPLFLLP